jgi:ribonuclease J
LTTTTSTTTGTTPGATTGTTPGATPGAALRLTPLGGVGRFGRNCLLVEDVASGAALVIDCGIRFPGPELPGFDAALPDLERLTALGDRVLAYVVTHGHEDHIGALPFALRERAAPVVCTSFSSRFVARRCARFGVSAVLDIVGYGDVRELGPFTVRFAAVSHSIPGAASVVLSTPVGVVVHSGDFRVDDDPVLGPPTDLVTLEGVARSHGVVCLLADSTGAQVPGRNAGERSVVPALDRCFAGVGDELFRGAIFVALFASHLQRLALLVDACRRHHRRLLLLGRGLKEALQMALAEGVLAADDVLVSESAARTLPRERLCVAVTGSQGEPDAVLGRLARARMSSTTGADVPAVPPGLPVGVARGDRVVLSARIVPGNEGRVQPLLDGFVDAGVDVVAGRRAPHVSGHGHAEDLQLLLAATRPRTFVALHGDPGHLVAHGGLAAGLGVDDHRVVALRDGHTLLLARDGDDVALTHVRAEGAREPAAAGDAVAWFPRGIVDCRRRLGTAGVLVVSVGAAVDGGRAIALVGRGLFPTVDDDNDVIPRVRHLFGAALAERGVIDDDAVRAAVRAFVKAGRAAPEIVVVDDPR